MRASSSSGRIAGAVSDAVSGLIHRIVPGSDERRLMASLFSARASLVGPTLLDIDVIGEDVVAAHQTVHPLGEPARPKLLRNHHRASHFGDPHPGLGLCY